LYQPYSITIPDSVTLIEEGAFHECGNLTSVTIGSGVKKINEGAFSGCDKLTSVTFQVDSIIMDSDWSPFPVNLRDKYLKEGAGTYKRASGDWDWTKQL